MTGSIPSETIERRCWRVLPPKWAARPLSGDGAARHGGRHNEPGRPALYLSEDLNTAVAEYEQDLGTRPGTFCAYQIRIAGMVDLTRPEARDACGIAEQELLYPWKKIAFIEGRRPPTWDLAGRLFTAGFAGVRVPSARQPGGVNIVLWRWNDHPDRQITAHDPQGDLPRNQDSWRH